MSWLWRSDDTSPASFEKALSKLSTQITAASLSLETARSRARRIKGLWTLWTTIVYLIYAVIIILVPGPQWSSTAYYAGLIGGPVLIYAVRQGLTLLFDWQINRRQAHLSGLQKQRQSKITDLKKATKYDSTQELLQKYGGAPPKETDPTKKEPMGKKNTPQQQRTGIPPPPTANIPGRSPPNPRPQIQPPQGIQVPGSPTHISQSPGQFSPDLPGFAPNAFTAPSSYQQQPTSPHWYDRILDVMIGEDESAAKHRLALICSNCRLVNGQAPPGVMTLEQVGRWRCQSCGASNGTDEQRTAREMVERVRREGAGAAAVDSAPAEDNGWEQIAKGDEGPKEDVVLKGTEGSTGLRADDAEDVQTASKRVTRSMAATDDDD